MHGENVRAFITLKRGAAKAPDSIVVLDQTPDPAELIAFARSRVGYKWYDTGDLLSRDADGYLWFHGRQKQIIVHDGSNISPQEVEDALLLHPAVQLAGVVGVPHLVHGENVRAFITLKRGAATPDPAELIAFARSRVGYKAPDSIVVLDQMPLTASHKVDRTVLRQLSDQIT